MYVILRVSYHNKLLTLAENKPKEPKTVLSIYMFVSALFPSSIFCPKLFEKDIIVPKFLIVLIRKKISLTRGLVPLYVVYRRLTLVFRIKKLKLINKWGLNFKGRSYYEINICETNRQLSHIFKKNV